MTTKTFETKMLINKTTCYKDILDDKVCYIPKLDYELIESYDLDLFKVLISTKILRYG